MKADKSLKKTASGLVYKVIKKGVGAKPTKDQTAMVKYEGRHIDGSVFDDGQGQVQEFPVSRVVPGFSEGLMLMSPEPNTASISPAISAMESAAQEPAALSVPTRPSSSTWSL